jgi:hypothetical protein
MSPRLVEVLVAATALGIAAPAAAVLAFGSTTGSQFAYRSEGRVAKTARAVARSAMIEPAPIVVDETVIVAERPRARQAIAPTIATIATSGGCSPWRPTAVGPRARAAAPSAVRACDVLLDRAVEAAPPPASVPPRTPRPTLVFDYAIDAPN